MSKTVKTPAKTKTTEQKRSDTPRHNSAEPAQRRIWRIQTNKEHKSPQGANA